MYYGEMLHDGMKVRKMEISKLEVRKELDSMRFLYSKGTLSNTDILKNRAKVVL